jgi:hypothetical protein
VDNEPKNAQDKKDNGNDNFFPDKGKFNSNNNNLDSDQNGLEMLKYFNLTNEGRLRPAKRKSCMQAEALDIQKDLKERLRTVNELIGSKKNEDSSSSILQDIIGGKGEDGSSKATTGGDYDALDVFFQQETKKKHRIPEVFSVAEKKVQQQQVPYQLSAKSILEKPIQKRESESNL